MFVRLIGEKHHPKVTNDYDLLYIFVHVCNISFIQPVTTGHLVLSAQVPAAMVEVAGERAEQLARLRGMRRLPFSIFG